MIEETQLDDAARSFGAEPAASILDDWRGVVWLKPAIHDCEQWARSLVARYRSGETDGALILVPGRTDTRYCQYLIRQSDCMCALRGRVRFHGKRGGAPFPSIIFYIGQDLDRFIETFEPFANGFGQEWDKAKEWEQRRKQAQP